MQYFWSFCISCSTVLWAGFSILLIDIYFGFVFSLCGDSDNPVPQKIVFMLFCSWCIVRWKCDGVWRLCWIEFVVTNYCDLILIWIKVIQHIHCLPSCPQMNITHSSMNRMTAIVFHTEQHVGRCDWYQHHKICNISRLNSHFLSQFMLKWNLYQDVCLSAFVSNYFNLWKSVFTTWHRTTMLKCRTDSEVEIFLGM